MATLREWLASGPYTLGLSSGFFGFFAHAGVIRVLEEAAVPPARLAGSSAGALAGGLFAAGLEGGAICDALLGLRRQDFWDPAPGLGLLRGARFRARLEAILPVRSFEACPRRLAVSAHDVAAGRAAVLSSGDLATAIHASCAVPLLFQPVRLGGRIYLDGGLSDRPGLASVAPGERVLFHHLGSRSPWRRPGSPALRVPVRPGLHAVTIEGLPRVGPWRLERGREAMRLAGEGMRRALDLELSAAEG